MGKTSSIKALQAALKTGCCDVAHGTGEKDGLPLMEGVGEGEQASWESYQGNRAQPGTATCRKWKKEYVFLSHCPQNFF